MRIYSCFSAAKLFSIIAAGSFFMKRLTIKVTIKARGNAIKIGSIAFHGYGSMVSTLKIKLEILRAPEVDAWTNNIQNMEEKIPVTIPLTTPVLVAPFQ